jgi:16S rRNA (uracil1498-N3)-methyltransferase
MGEELTEPGGRVRLYVEAPLGEGSAVVLGDSRMHYLLHVMRAKLGDQLRLFNGRNGEWCARIVEIAKRGCRLECEVRTAQQHEVPDLWLIFAPIKKTPADYLVQKATELGVRVLQPMSTRRTIVARVNLERMRANAVEAAEQSGRLSVPEIRNLVAFKNLLASWPKERRILFCDEAGEAPPIADGLREAPAGPWAVFIGPEGGFDPAERAQLRTFPNVVAISLGERILRADTAALAALTVWQTVKGDWRRV